MTLYLVGVDGRREEVLDGARLKVMMVEEGNVMDRIPRVHVQVTGEG